MGAQQSDQAAGSSQEVTPKSCDQQSDQKRSVKNERSPVVDKLEPDSYSHSVQENSVNRANTGDISYVNKKITNTIKGDAFEKTGVNRGGDREDDLHDKRYRDSGHLEDFDDSEEEFQDTTEADNEPQATYDSTGSNRELDHVKPSINSHQYTNNRDSGYVDTSEILHTAADDDARMDAQVFKDNEDDAEGEMYSAEYVDGDSVSQNKAADDGGDDENSSEDRLHLNGQLVDKADHDEFKDNICDDQINDCNDMDISNADCGQVTGVHVSEDNSHDRQTDQDLCDDDTDNKPLSDDQCKDLINDVKRDKGQFDGHGCDVQFDASGYADGDFNASSLYNDQTGYDHDDRLTMDSTRDEHVNQSQTGQDNEDGSSTGCHPFEKSSDESMEGVNFVNQSYDGQSTRESNNAEHDQFHTTEDQNDQISKEDGFLDADHDMPDVDTIHDHDLPAESSQECDAIKNVDSATYLTDNQTAFIEETFKKPSLVLDHEDDIAESSIEHNADFKVCTSSNKCETASGRLENASFYHGVGDCMAVDSCVDHVISHVAESGQADIRPDLGGDATCRSDEDHRNTSTPPNVDSVSLDFEEQDNNQKSVGDMVSL